jgi:hypothetical protein
MVARPRLTMRCSQPLAALKTQFMVESLLLRVKALAAASGGSAPSFRWTQVAAPAMLRTMALHDRAT